MTKNIENGLCEKTAEFLEESLGKEQCKNCRYLLNCSEQLGIDVEVVQADLLRKENKLKLSLYRCRECGTECLSRETPKPKKWADGHMCNFKKIYQNKEAKITIKKKEKKKVNRSAI